MRCASARRCRAGNTRMRPIVSAAAVMLQRDPGEASGGEARAEVAGGVHDCTPRAVSATYDALRPFTDIILPDVAALFPPAFAATRRLLPPPTVARPVACRRPPSRFPIAPLPRCAADRGEMKAAAAAA